MKALRLALVAAILSFAMVSYAGIKPTPVNVVKITLKEALHDPGLQAEMRAQLKFNSLKVVKPGVYVGVVTYHKTVYQIHGTRTEWVRFFLSKQKSAVGTQNWLE